ncbi:UPF0246 protein [Oxalicibacterium flavum]|uniref:UPF0246 protein GCM10007205_10760 n=1 Tax=Oxalicibacterium flavum TaxID=179467 RepID=A0A8J2UKE6_9BURK|nr:peroxide stress protein YaaA [Oxalicibacterium flavum]GGC03410.1 UPF0246 protein [Oxalicibacterium flavum]
MLIVLSPAKTLDYDTPAHTDVSTRPDFVKRSAELIDILRRQSPAQIASLMKISDKLATLNVNRYAEWSTRFTVANSKQAMLAFNGDVYEGLNAATMNAAQLQYAQAHLRILSGLYGLLRPLDLMQPYRLEMGTRLANPAGKDLYAFWDDEVTQALNRQIAETGATALVNLASEEYFKVVRPALLDVPVVTPVFLDWKDGKYKVISFHAKRARGLMARYAIDKAFVRPQQLKKFDTEGYVFDESGSNESTWVFKRKIAE